MPRPTPTATALTLALLLTGCNNNTATPPPFTPSPEPTSPSVTATPTTTGGPEELVAAAYRRYIAVTDAMTASGGVKIKDLPSVATGVELSASLLQAENYRAQKLRTIGTTEVIWVKPTKVNAPSSGKGGTAIVEACYDTSKAQAIDRNGKVVREPGTPTRWLDRRDLVFVDRAWKVSNGRNRGAKC